jgi:hypothetical protein
LIDLDLLRGGRYAYLDCKARGERMTRKEQVESHDHGGLMGQVAEGAGAYGEALKTAYRRPVYGKDNPHPLSTMKTELVWEGKYDEYGNR